MKGIDKSFLVAKDQSAEFTIVNMKLRNDISNGILCRLEIPTTFPFGTRKHSFPDQ